MTNPKKLNRVEKECAACDDSKELGRQSMLRHTCHFQPKGGEEEECKHLNVQYQAPNRKVCMDCGMNIFVPANHPADEEEEWEAELQFGIMEDYLRTAEMTRFAKNPKDHMEEMRQYWEKLKSFISQSRQEAIKSEKERVIGILEKLKITFPDFKNEDNRGREVMRSAWNQAILEAIKAIKENEK